MDKKRVFIIAAILLAILFLIWLFFESSKSLPGQKITDLGRGHVPIGTEVKYNSNPPTSGKHYEEWVRAGIYENPKDDRNLVHSLEHGYIIISYNCNKQGIGYRVQGTVYAHGIEEEASQSPQESTPATLPDAFRSEDCHKLVDQLISVYEKKDKKKLIIIPRLNLDSKIALTAWNYLDKFDPSTSSGLSVSDMERIEKFIDAYFEMGPEKTME